MSNPNIAIVESYLHALRDKDLGRMPLAGDVSFEDPLSPRLGDRASVVAFIGNFLPALKGLTIRQHIAEGQCRHYMGGGYGLRVVPIFECFRVVEGQIKEIIAFLDPRPFTKTES